MLVLDVELPPAASRIHSSHQCESETIRRLGFAFPVRVMRVTHAHLTRVADCTSTSSMCPANVSDSRARSASIDAQDVVVMSHSHRLSRSCGIMRSLYARRGRARHDEASHFRSRRRLATSRCTDDAQFRSGSALTLRSNDHEHAHTMRDGIHHRVQVVLLLPSLGHTPGNFDMLEYYQRNR